MSNGDGGRHGALDLEAMRACDAIRPLGHPKREGGNDYHYCPDCGLMWDYRRETSAQKLLDLALAEVSRLRAARDITLAPALEALPTTCEHRWVTAWERHERVGRICWQCGLRQAAGTFEKLDTALRGATTHD